MNPHRRVLFLFCKCFFPSEMSRYLCETQKTWLAGKKQALLNLWIHMLSNILKKSSHFCIYKWLVDWTERNVFNNTTDFCMYIKVQWRNKDDFANLFSKRNFESRIDKFSKSPKFFLFQGLEEFAPVCQSNARDKTLISIV